MLDAEEAVKGDAVSTDNRETMVVAREPPGAWLHVGSLLAPVLKCAFCPVCLGLFGGALAGARLGFLSDERVHLALITVAIVFDVAILGAAFRHHRRRAPLVLCAVGALTALGGHLGSGLVQLEYLGFGVLMVAAIWNVVLLRIHHQSVTSCCAHDQVMEET
jgi:hypothetical protein